jgi:ParB family chromosome partitioning protein
MKEPIQQEKKLGRGLSALLGESKANILVNANQNQKGVETISLKKIIAGVYQPRKNFDENELQELATSISENGLIQPIILRKVGDEDEYEIIAGERRFRAAKLAGLSEIAAVVKKINNHEALEMAIVENVQRSDLSLIEEAFGYKQLIDDFSYSQDQIAKKIGKSRSHIANLLRLLNLPEKVRKFLDQKLLSMGHARAIINSADAEKLAKKIIDEDLSVRDVENLVRDEKVEKIKNTPVLVRNESKIKFVNSSHLVELEKEVSQLLNLETNISYNSFKNSGKITIKFGDFDKIKELIERLKKSNTDPSQ